MSTTIAYLAGTFPLRSETFVYREVRALRTRGWNLIACSLNAPDETPAALEDLVVSARHVYGNGIAASMILELVTHPIRSAGTLCAAIRDAISPGEPTALASRLKLLPQSLAAIGFARRLRRLGVQHIHCHFAHAPTTVGMYAAKQLGTLFTFTGHANDLFQRRT